MSAPYYQDDRVTLYHGDCMTETTWLEADVLVTDPPYGTDNGVGYGRRFVHNAAAGRHGMRISGDATTEVRDAALCLWDREREHGRGAKQVACFGSPRMPEPPGEWDCRLVWDKVEPGMNGGPWRYTHELIFVRGEGWTRLDASSYSILRFPKSGGMGNDERSEHPHRKPIGLMLSLVAPAPPGIITDPFAGSGSTLVAAKQLGRTAIGVEIDEAYCEVIAKRLSQDVLDFGEVTA
jgi:site-specific DNA-methyltransferase (adenine-specific)